MNLFTLCRDKSRREHKRKDVSERERDRYAARRHGGRQGRFELVLPARRARRRCLRGQLQPQHLRQRLLIELHVRSDQSTKRSISASLFFVEHPNAKHSSPDPTNLSIRQSKLHNPTTTATDFARDTQRFGSIVRFVDQLHTESFTSFTSSSDNFASGTNEQQ